MWSRDAQQIAEAVLGDNIAFFAAGAICQRNSRQLDLSFVIQPF